MNIKIGECLKSKADELSSALTGEDNQISTTEYQNVVGNLDVDFPNCPARSTGGGSGSSSSNIGAGHQM